MVVIWSSLYTFLTSFDLAVTWFWQHKWKWAVVSGSGSESQLHIGFMVSKKLCLNLASLRWLRFSLKRVSNLIPLLLWIPKMEFPEVLTKLSNGFLNDTGGCNYFMSFFKLFYFSKKLGNKVLLKLAVLEGVCFTIVFALVDWIIVELKIRC